MEITGTATGAVIGTTIIVRRKEEELTGPASETGAGIRGAAGVMTGIVTDFIIGGSLREAETFALFLTFGQS